MNVWPEDDFTELVADKTGGNEKTLQSDYLPIGDYPIVDQGQALIGGYTNDATRLCKAELPVIVFGDHTKCFKFIDFPFCLGADGTKVLRPKKALNERYLFYALQRINIPDSGYSRHFKYLKEGKIPLPPLDEQKRIAAILDQADELRRKRQRAIDRLGQLGQAIFHDMFDRSDSSIALQEACTLVTDGTHYTPTYAENGIVFLSAKNVTQLRIDWKNVKYVPESLHLKLQKRVAPRLNDVLLAKNGTTGVAALVDRDVVFDIYVSLALLRPSDAVLPKFLLYAVNNHKTRRQFDGSLKGVGVSNLHLVDIRRATIPFPSIEAQAEFVRRIEALEKTVTSNRHAIDMAQSLFASLQHRAFQGEL